MKNNNYPAFYKKITSGIRRSENGIQILIIVNRLMTLLMYVLYPVMILVLLVTGFLEDGLRGAVRIALPYIFIPGVSFVLLTIIRDRLDWKRPYEEYDLQPLIQKETRGHSMPSRHVFSCTVIAMCVLSQNVPAGVICLFCSVVLSAVRVLGGVHYPRDVIAGFVIGMLAGSLFFVFS